MSTLAELERSIYQRGLILTGEPAGAGHITGALLARYDNLLRVGESALARSIVQESRAWPRERERAKELPAFAWSPPHGAPGQLFQAVRALPSQQREAWTLMRLEELGEVDAARAMDCSRTALREVHLAGAENSLRPLLGSSYESALVDLRASLRAVDPASPLADLRKQLRVVVLRKRMVRLLMFVAFAAVCGILWWVMTDLHKANDREIEQRRLYEAEQQKFSLPMSPEEKAQ